MRGLELTGSRMTDDTISERIKRKQITLNQMMVCGLGSKGRCRQIVWNSLAFIRHMIFFKHTSSFFFVSKWTFKSNIKTLVKVIWVYVKFITNELLLPVSSPHFLYPSPIPWIRKSFTRAKGKDKLQESSVCYRCFWICNEIKVLRKLRIEQW